MGFTEACMKLNSHDNTQSSSYTKSGVEYPELVSLQAATSCHDCLPGTRIDHRAITRIAWSWLLPHIWYGNTATPHYSANVSATFSPPLATLTRQDSRSLPENDKKFMSTLKDGPFHRQLHTDPTSRDSHGGYTGTT